MKFQSTATVVAIAALGLFFAQAACKSDPFNCKDEKQGSVVFEQKTKDFYPLNGSETLVFKSAAGAEMTFNCDSPKIERYPVHVERLCQSTNLQDHFGYFDADSETFAYKSNSSIAPISFEIKLMTANAILKNKNETALFDHFSCTLFDGAGGSEIIVLVSDRGTDAALLAEISDNQKFGFFAQKEIGGKNYTDIYVGKPIFGTPPDSKLTVYFQKNVGVVAFSLADGTVFSIK